MIAADSAIDWTLGKDELVAAIKATDLLAKTIRRCGTRYCEGDGPEPLSYDVRCQTCDWQWDADEYDEGPLTREDAERMAMDHECEPWIEIQSPVTGKWHEKWSLSAAEKKATDQDGSVSRGCL